MLLVGLKNCIYYIVKFVLFKTFASRRLVLRINISDSEKRFINEMIILVPASIIKLYKATKWERQCNVRTKCLGQICSFQLIWQSKIFQIVDMIILKQILYINFWKIVILDIHICDLKYTRGNIYFK